MITAVGAIQGHHVLKKKRHVLLGHSTLTLVKGTDPATIGTTHGKTSMAIFGAGAARMVQSKTLLMKCDIEVRRINIAIVYDSIQSGRDRYDPTIWLLPIFPAENEDLYSCPCEDCR